MAEQIMVEESEERRLDAAFEKGREHRRKIMEEIRESLSTQDIDYQDAFWSGFYD